MWTYASELFIFTVILIPFSNTSGQLPSETSPSDTSTLLPFGNRTNDLYGPSGDDSSSPPLTLREPITFFGRQYGEIIVNSNGVISLGNITFTDYLARPFPINSAPVIAPFWADINPSAGGRISYRQSNDSALLQLASSLAMGLNDGYLTDFVPTNLFIATWDQVPPFGTEEVYNTFQVVLATDASQTVAIFIYDDIQWERRTQIGFNFGDGENSLTISQTVLDQILNISELSNIGKRGVFVFRLDNINVVECSTSPGCITSDLGLKFPRECCIDTPTGLAYTIPDSDVCYVCIVFGWLNDSFTGMEQEEAHVISIGYQKGADQVGFSVTFNIEVQQTPFGRESSDVMVNTEIVQILPNISPVNVEVTFLADDVALESNETIVFELAPSGRVSVPSGEGVYFLKTIKVTIIDKDILDIYLSEENYQATESDMLIEVSVCKNKRISLGTPTILLGVSTETLLDSSANETLLVIPANNPLSPNRADFQDFESRIFQIPFIQDEERPSDCKSISVPIIDDAINEADQFFVIHLNIIILDFRIDPEKITLSRNVSLGWIIDDDSIKIGFELPSYTFIEPPFEDQLQIFLATEDSRQSEQTFKVSIELTTLNSSESDLYQPATFDEDYIIANRTTSILLLPFMQRIPYQFSLLPDDIPGEVESFFVMISNSWDDQFSMYLPPSLYAEVASIVIIDTENTIGFSQELVAVWEGQGVVQITVFSYPSVTSLDDLVLNFTTYSGNATEGSDYEGCFQKSVLLSPNSSSTIEVKILNDKLAEGIEIFFGELAVSGPTQNFSVMIEIEILDDEERGVCGNKIANKNCSENASCEVLNGRVLTSCSCNNGFLGNGFICRDIDECDNGEDNCDINAVCFNTPGSYNCHCDRGFVGNGTLCIASINQVPSPCISDSDCTCFEPLNASSTVECGCLPGYEVVRVKNCHDINECDHSPCGVGTCINTDGSFFCLCPLGYFFDEFSCVDLNECNLGPDVNGCNRNAECRNTDGSFICSCKDGFSGDGVICWNDSQDLVCEPRNTEMCGCLNGYYFELRSRTCRDVNECRMYHSICNKSARCVNTPGSFMCQCRDGFRGDGIICNDINECHTGLHDCDENAFCINTVGSFTCSCNPSFFGNGRDCRMGVPPLINSPSIPVHPNHNLSYTIGTDFCLEDADSFPNGVFIHCPVIGAAIPHPHFHMTAIRAAADGTKIGPLLSGQTDYLSLDRISLSSLFDSDTVFVNITCSVSNFFGGDDMTTSVTVCDPTDCQDGVTNNCSQICTRSFENMYECDCYNGYMLNMDVCVDTDECVDTSMHNCSEVDHEVCQNLEGSYVCDCSSGFERRGNVCQDADECAKMAHNCTEIEVCQNTPGSFICLCIEGFQKRDDLCVDIDECSNVTLHTCFEHNHQVCINMLGSYACECALGFQHDSSNICHDVNECNLLNGNCSQLCNNTDGSYSCDCEDGFILDIQDYSTCHDINECQLRSHNCHSNAICINTLGSFKCQCESQYEGNGITCQVSESVVIGSALGVGSILLIIGLLLTVVGICCYIRHSHHIVKKGNFNLSLPECIRQRGGNSSPLIPRTASDASQLEPVVKTFSVQSSYKLKLPPHLIIPSSSIKLVEPVGQGEFGIVYKGYIIKGQVVTKIVAIKTLKGFYDSAVVKEMLKECSKMYSFKHPNVLTLNGVCLDGGPNPYIIMPFMTNGSLLAYIKKNRGRLTVASKDNSAEEVKSVRKQLMDMCIQVSKGMKYLADKKVVHRDLAARNCMIDINFVIKVADFGLSESVGTKEYFRQDKSSMIKLPLKWLAPESMEDYIFSEKSDVWAYGVTCWEIFSGGKVPYPSIDLSDLPRLLTNGYRLEKPDNDACNSEIYTYMLQCWEINPERRPSFSNLVDSLSNYLESLADYVDFGSKSLEAMHTKSVELPVLNAAFLEKECCDTALEDEV